MVHSLEDPVLVRNSWAPDPHPACVASLVATAGIEVLLLMTCDVIMIFCLNIPSDSFLFNTLSNQLARCPFCRKLSTVGPEFARTRGTVFLVLFIITLLVGIGAAVGTKSYLSAYKGLIALYVGLFLVAAIFFFRSIYYLSMRVSIIESSASA